MFELGARVASRVSRGCVRVGDVFSVIECGIDRDLDGRTVGYVLVCDGNDDRFTFAPADLERVRVEGAFVWAV